MVIKACMSCKYHKMREDEDHRSYCLKEYCWSEYSDCMSLKALEHFLGEQRIPVTMNDPGAYPLTEIASQRHE